VRVPRFIYIFLLSRELLLK